MGYAYLPDGRRIDYEQYLETPEWHQKRMNRLAFDNWCCSVCHREIGKDDTYHTHHLSYAHLGHEDVEHDIVTMCIPCHTEFHQRWSRNAFFDKGDTSPITHWKDYSLRDTAQLCYLYECQDYWFGGDFNLCSQEADQAIIDRYFNEHAADQNGAVISEDDIRLYIRNRRYDLILESEKKKVPMETFLDEKFGVKQRKGGNARRASARQFYAHHSIGAIKRIYKENENILILMDEVNKIKGENNNE